MVWGDNSKVFGMYHACRGRDNSNVVKRELQIVWGCNTPVVGEITPKLLGDTSNK